MGPSLAVLWWAAAATLVCGEALWPPVQMVPSFEAVAKGEAACPYSVKIYVYEFSDELPFKKMAAQARRDPGGTHFDGEHLLAQFTLEFILTDFFEQACVRTTDPEEADYFFVPFYSDLEYRTTGRPNEPSAHGDALLKILEENATEAWLARFGATDAYWRKYPERHLLVQAAPVTGWRHPKGKRGFAHYLVQLTAPIFLSIEVTKSWTLTYPKCAAKNVVLPYPVPGKGWHDNSWRAMAEALDPSRPILALFRGGRNHGCVNVRKAIAKALERDPEIQKAEKQLQTRNGGAIPRQALMHLATFCPCPEGDSPSAKRMYDAVLAGCVPVLVSDDAVYSYDEFASPWAFQNFSLNVSDFAVVVAEQDAIDGKLLPYLRSHAVHAALPTLRANLERVAALLRYYAPGRYPRDPLVDRRFPDGGANALLVWDLERRKLRETPDHRWLACQRELQTEHHFHHAKQFCGAPPKDDELNRLRTMLKRAPSEKRRGELQRAIHDWESGSIFRRQRRKRRQRRLRRRP